MVEAVGFRARWSDRVQSSRVLVVMPRTTATPPPRKKRRPEHGYEAHPPVTEFGRVLDGVCDARGWSFGELCRVTQMEISLISRYRSGGREVTRKSIRQLTATIPDLSDDERRRLYESAGFIPEWREVA